MEYIKIDLEKGSPNYRSISARELIIDAGKNGYKFRGCIPHGVTVNGTILSYTLAFSTEIDPVEYSFVGIKQTNTVENIFFEGVDDAITFGEESGMEYLGYVPVYKDGRKAIDLVFAF